MIVLYLSSICSLFVLYKHAVKTHGGCTCVRTYSLQRAHAKTYYYVPMVWGLGSAMLACTGDVAHRSRTMVCRGGLIKYLWGGSWSKVLCGHLVGRSCAEAFCKGLVRRSCAGLLCSGLVQRLCGGVPGGVLVRNICRRSSATSAGGCLVRRSCVSGPSFNATLPSLLLHTPAPPPPRPHTQTMLRIGIPGGKRAHLEE